MFGIPEATLSQSARQHSSSRKGLMRKQLQPNLVGTGHKPKSLWAHITTMAGTRARINIYVPSECRFPELTIVGGNRDPVQWMLPRISGDKTEQSVVAEVAAATKEGDAGVKGSGRSLYVYDSEGRMLEHVRYQGNDYRGALRAAISATPNHWRD
ncbi:uncharacterized protein Dvir_GJ16525, isoform B [Drosophila virilis]|uniref:Uncharacterized protein, isoform B n=1 Tax=Drosophila virilis TaxID=7244 RepID=B4M738_DROVI|nr:uncharacterized protein Dvir_GJ16525, isoform B [Drosophila virilis]